LYGNEIGIKTQKLTRILGQRIVYAEWEDDLIELEFASDRSN